MPDLTEQYCFLIERVTLCLLVVLCNVLRSQQLASAICESVVGLLFR